jgi:2'-5' RNA ligase
MDLRCFISIELPQALKQKITSVIERLVKTGADVRWVVPENLHVTLKFLGPTPGNLIPDIEEKLRRAAGAHGRFTLKLSGAGAFPNERRPRVVWIGLVDSDELLGLQRDIDASMEELGFEREDRPFSPHLTLGRVKSPRGNIALAKELDALRGFDIGVVEVGSVSLMKSELSPKGSKYTELFAAPLKTLK